MLFLILTRILPNISPLYRCTNQGTNRLNGILKVTLIGFVLEHLVLSLHFLMNTFQTDISQTSSQEPYVWFLLRAIGISLFYQLQLRWLGTVHLSWLILQLLLLNIMFFWSGVGFWAITHQRLIYQYSNNCKILQWVRFTLGTSG